MDEDVRLQLADEEQRQRIRIAAAHGAGLHRALEVIGEQPQRAPRWDLFRLRVERHDEGRRMQVHGDRRTDHGADERDDLVREIREHDARVALRIRRREIEDEIRQVDPARAHRRAEERLFRIEVPEDRGRRDPELARDVRERRAGEAARAERAASGVENLIARDARRASHDVSKRRFTNTICQWLFTNWRKRRRDAL